MFTKSTETSEESPAWMGSGKRRHERRLQRGEGRRSLPRKEDAEWVFALVPWYARSYADGMKEAWRARL